MMHHYAKFCFEGLSGSEDIVWTKIVTLYYNLDYRDSITILSLNILAYDDVLLC